MTTIEFITTVLAPIMRGPRRFRQNRRIGIDLSRPFALGGHRYFANGFLVIRVPHDGPDNMRLNMPDPRQFPWEGDRIDPQPEFLGGENHASYPRKVGGSWYNPSLVDLFVLLGGVFHEGCQVFRDGARNLYISGQGYEVLLAPMGGEDCMATFWPGLMNAIDRLLVAQRAKDRKGEDLAEIPEDIRIREEPKP